MSIRDFSAWLGELIAPYDPILKVVSYIIGPTFAVIAFWWSRRDRRELIAKAGELERATVNYEEARKHAAEAQTQIVEARREVDAKEAEVSRLRRNLESITGGAHELWKLRPAKVFSDYLGWIRDHAGARVITIGNLKGGVGKTTLAANFAAYISETRKKPVLLIDLDYQGSLSNMLMLAVGREEVESRIDWLLDESANLATLDRATIHLVPKLNRGWLVPANYTFAQIENRLLLQWLLQQDGGVDVRYRLAHLLLRPEVRQRYAAIILDTPPRMTLGSINALVASHCFIVPTVLDSLSVEAVGQFLTNMRAIKRDLGLDIDLAGIVGMMTRTAHPSAVENRALDLAREAGTAWREEADFAFATTIPRKVAIANAAGEDIAYFGDDNGGSLSSIFDPLFEEICKAVWKGNGP